MMAHLVRDHVRPSEVAAAAELALHVLVKGLVEVDAGVRGAVEGPDGGASRCRSRRLRPRRSRGRASLPRRCLPTLRTRTSTSSGRRQRRTWRTRSGPRWGSSSGGRGCGLSAPGGVAPEPRTWPTSKPADGAAAEDLDAHENENDDEAGASAELADQATGDRQAAETAAAGSTAGLVGAADVDDVAVPALGRLPLHRAAA